MSDKYRDRKIADIVTGQTDVRGWATGTANGVTEEGPAAWSDHQDIESYGEKDNGDE